MPRRSILEYVQALRSRYLGASKEGKGKMLDEFTKVIGCHRKAAIRLLHRRNQPRRSKKRGRPRQYGAAMADAGRLKVEANRIDRLSNLKSGKVSSNSLY